MILVTGGAYQGKLDYAKTEYGLTDDDVFTCEEGSTAIGFDEKIVDHFERYVLALIKAGQVPERAVGMQIRAGRYKNRIIICDDISQGIVPMDKTERAWREGVGRTMVKVAQQADKVVRLFCGIPEVLKDETKKPEEDRAPKTDGLEAVFASEKNGAVKADKEEMGGKVEPAEETREAAGENTTEDKSSDASQNAAKRPQGNPKFASGRQQAQAFASVGQGGLFSQIGLPHLQPGENGAEEGLTPEEQFRKMFEQMKKDRAAAKKKQKEEEEK